MIGFVLVLSLSLLLPTLAGVAAGVRQGDGPAARLAWLHPLWPFKPWLRHARWERTHLLLICLVRQRQKSARLDRPTRL